MTIETPVTIFTTLMTRVIANPDWAKRVNTVYRIIVTGDDGGDWLADVLSTTVTPIVKVYAPEDASKVLCTMTLSSADFMAIYNNVPGAGLSAFAAGRIVVIGDKTIAAKIRMLLSIAK